MKNIYILGLLIILQAAPLCAFADITCDDALAEAAEQYKNENYKKARESFQFVIERCGLHYGDAHYWTMWKHCKEKTKNSIWFGHWIGAEFGYDHLFMNYHTDRTMEIFTEERIKSGMDGFHFGPTYRFYDWDTGLGMRMGLWYQFVTCYGNIFSTKEENQEFQQAINDIKDDYKQTDAWKRWSVYHRSFRHAFQIPIQFCYTLNDLDDFGMSIYCGPTFEVGLVWKEVYKDLGVVKNSTDEIWYGLDGVDVSGMRLGIRESYNYYTGVHKYVEYTSTGVQHEKEKNPDGGDLSRWNILLGGGISFNLPYVQFGVECEYGILNMIAPHRREIIYNGVACQQFLHVTQLTINFSFAVDL